MRMKKIVENRTLKSAATEFLAFKRAQKIRERTLHDYPKYIKGAFFRGFRMGMDFAVWEQGKRTGKSPALQ